MDETKKALLSIDIDTTALNQNIANAKAALIDLTAQLKEIKSSGNESSETFSKIAELLKKAGEEASKGKEVFKEYIKALGESSKGANELKQGLSGLNAEQEKLAIQQQNVNKQTTEGSTALTLLQQKLADGKAGVSDMTAQFKDLLMQQINLTTEQRSNGLVLGELRGKQEMLMKQIKEAKTTNLEYTNSINKLTTGQGNANREIINGTPAVTGYSKTLKEYAQDLIKAAESANPVAKSIGDAAKEFKTFKDITGQVGDGLTNYKNKVLSTLEQSKTFNSGASAGAKALEVLKVSSQVASGGFEGLGKAISGSGVGLFIIVLASAIEYFKKFTPLVEFCQRTTAGLSGAFDALSNIIGKLLQPLLRVFTEPKQALIDFGQFLLHNLINRFTALGTIIEGIIHLDFKKMTNGVIQLNTGVTNGIEKMQGFGKAIGNAYTQTAKLTGAQQDLDRQIQTSGIKSAENAAKIAELRVKAQTNDLTLRKKYLKDIEDIEKQETETHKKQIEEQVRITAGKIVATHKLSMAEIGDISKLDSAKIESLRISKGLNAEEVKSLQEAVKKMAELRKEEADKMLKPSATVQPHHKKAKPKKPEPEVAARGQNLGAMQTTDIGQGQPPVLGNDFATITANQSLAIKKKEEEDAAKFTKKTIKEELALVEEKTKGYQSHFTKLAGMFSKNTQAGKAALMAHKALAVAEIAINTEKQVSSIFTATREAVVEDMKIPIIGSVKAAIDIAMGAAEVVGTIANGVKQAATLNSVSPQGFARGGLYLSDGYGTYLSGSGTGTSDSINARLSNGESIINARSTQMFAPILSAINQAGGGRAFNTTNPGNGYALGGLFNGSNTLNDGYSDLANTRALNDMAKTLATNMPRQVLVVEDVQASLQNKAMLQAMSNF